MRQHPTRQALAVDTSSSQPETACQTPTMIQKTE